MNITKHQLEEIVAKYNRGEDTGYTDEEYDVLLETYLKTYGEENRPFLRQKQSGSINSIVGTLSKVYGVTTPMREGQSIYSTWAEKLPLMGNVIIQPKFDGLSVAYDCKNKRFFTRGDYDNGESTDVTSLFQSFDMSEYCQYESVKFEAIMSVEKYHDLISRGNHYETARSAASGLVSSMSDLVKDYITLMPLRCYRNGEQFVCDKLMNLSKTCNVIDYPCIQSFIDDHLLKGGPFIDVDGSTYAVDGCVVTYVNDNLSTQKEIAIKIIKDIRTSTLKDIQFQFGKQGNITPVAIFEPIQFGNITVDHATLSTVKRAEGLKYGDTIRIMYNIVPYFVDSQYNGDVEFKIPTRCPHCNQLLFIGKDRKTVQCINRRCNGLIIGGIIRYCQSLKMFGISDATINRFWEANKIASIADLYKLTVDDIMSIDGYKEKSANNIINSIRKSSTNIPLEKFLGALPINDTSEKTWKLVLNGCDVINAILDGNMDDFVMNLKPIDGIGDITISKLVDGLRFNMDLIQYLLRNGLVTVVLPVKRVGKRVAMTGTRDKDLTKYLEEKGYIVDSFTKDCVALIVPDHSFTSAKTIKAKQCDIPIYNIQEGYEKL